MRKMLSIKEITLPDIRHGSSQEYINTNYPHLLSTHDEEILVQLVSQVCTEPGYETSALAEAARVYKTDHKHPTRGKNAKHTGVKGFCHYDKDEDEANASITILCLDGSEVRVYTR